MIVDTSAIMAILFQEPEGERFADMIAQARSPRISAGSWIELAAVLTRGRNTHHFDTVENLADAFGLSIEPVTINQARIGHAAYRTFGRGTKHRANLNFGDYFAYALAIDTDEPLLFKGDDFTQTDVRHAT